MCGRFATQKLIWDQIVALSRLMNILCVEAPLIPRYNISPAQDIPVILAGQDGFRCAMAYWGLVPLWWKKPLEEKKSNTINVKSKEAHGKASFKGPLKHQRCLIPAMNYYEWRSGEDGKTPFYIDHKDKTPLYFAGLWTRFQGLFKGDVVDFLTVTMMTIGANAYLKEIHPRMPVILHGDDHEKWLTGDVAVARSLCDSYPSQLMTAFPIGKEVNSSRIEGKDREDLIIQIGPEIPHHL